MSVDRVAIVRATRGHTEADVELELDLAALKLAIWFARSRADREVFALEYVQRMATRRPLMRAAIARAGQRKTSKP